jgi:broad specificity phosphatase PhoE
METVRRINGALQTLVQSPLDRVLVVAHGGCINVALRDLLQTPVQTSFAFGDTSFSDLLVARRSDQVRLLSLNRTPHLTEGG